MRIILAAVLAAFALSVSALETNNQTVTDVGSQVGYTYATISPGYSECDGDKVWLLDTDGNYDEMREQLILAELLEQTINFDSEDHTTWCEATKLERNSP